MKHLFTILTATLLLCSVSVKADVEQTLTINGERLEKAVVRMTFDGDQVIIHFVDQTTQSADMATVKMDLSLVTDGIYSLKGQVGDLLDMQGLASGAEVVIYDASGRMVLQTKAGEAKTMLTTKALRQGIYMMKTGKQVVKFIKR
jgi:hypothetical protein